MYELSMRISVVLFHHAQTLVADISCVLFYMYCLFGVNNAYDDTVMIAETIKAFVNPIRFCSLYVPPIQTCRLNTGVAFICILCGTP